MVDDLPHILVVDDDRRIRNLLQAYLMENGFRISVAASAAEARERMRIMSFDLVVLDIMMPGETGLSLTEWLRAEGNPVPVLMLSALAEPSDRIAGLETGSDDYLAKPFEPRELVARLRAILRRAVAPADQDILVFGRLELDRGAREVRIDGEPRPLTAHQFEILRLLAERAGRVLSREQLLDLLKGQSLEPFDRSIDVHVSRIRAAIEDDPRKPRRLLTVRGAGYVFSRLQDEEAARDRRSR